MAKIRVQGCWCLLCVAVICVTGMAVGAKPATPPKPPAWTPDALTGKPKVAYDALLHTWKSQHHHFTATVRLAYMKFARARAAAELEAAHKQLPQEFLDWVDQDPLFACSVYGARQDPAPVLPMLYALEQDVGKKHVRKYPQLALAAASVHASQGPQADLAPRKPLQLTIPPCPLHAVDTKDPNRKLDVNDHIINFLKDHPPVAEVRPPEPNAKPKKGLPPLRDVYSETKAKYPVVAADVLASQALQDEFNAYMKAHGQTVEIHVGEHVISPDWHDMIDKANKPAVKAAFDLFRTAYEAKGLLPPERDPPPTPAEKLVFWIRNYETKLPPSPERKWPLFPLDAPWPLLTLLVADDQPLREVDDLWRRYRDTGERRGYGEYIGGIAQQFDMQSARRLCPYPFAYNTCQMMFKDGGVCGTMANIAVRTDNALGVPACTAGQPGHCALIYFELDPKTRVWMCRGGQYATGGDDKTHPHTPWYFGDVDVRKDMVYHQSIAWAVNYGLLSYVHSTLAYDLLRVLPEADRQAHGMDLVESALAINPYNFLLLDAGQALAATPQALFDLRDAFRAALAKVHDKPGCPTEGLYNRTVENNLYKRLAELPPPAEKELVGKVLAFLEHAQGAKAGAVVRYRIAYDGLPAALEQMKDLLQTSIRGERTPESCELLAAEIKALEAQVPDRAAKRQWMESLSQIIAGHEEYEQRKGRKSQWLADPCADTIYRALGKGAFPRVKSKA